MQFTAQSLNSGYFAMAEQLDLCDIEKVATKMGVTNASTGQPVDVNTQFSIIGSSNVVADRDGRRLRDGREQRHLLPAEGDRPRHSTRTARRSPRRRDACTQVLDPKVAATAAYALQGVMKAAAPARRPTRTTARRCSERPVRTRRTTRG